jgi:hypothetical protein
MIQGVLRLLTPGFPQSAAPSILLTKVLPTYVLRTASSSTCECFVRCPHLHLALCKKYVDMAANREAHDVTSVELRCAARVSDSAGGGADPEAIYNLCFILKITL